MTTVGRYLQLPPLPEIPEPVRGKSFVVVEAIHLGDPAQADELLEPMRALGPVNDTIATIPMPELSHLHLDPEQPVPGTGDGVTLARLPASAVDGARSSMPEPAPARRCSRSRSATSVASSHGRGRDTVLWRRSTPSYVLYAVGITPTREAAEAVSAHLDRLLPALQPWTARQRYLNLTETRDEQGAFWSEAAYHRLRRIKAAVDPEDLIRSNHPVPPGEHQG